MTGDITAIVTPWRQRCDARHFLAFCSHRVECLSLLDELVDRHLSTQRLPKLDVFCLVGPPTHVRHKCVPSDTDNHRRDRDAQRDEESCAIVFGFHNHNGPRLSHPSGNSARVEPEELLKEWLSELDAEERTEMAGMLMQMAERLISSCVGAMPTSWQPPSPLEISEQWRRRWR